MTPTKMAVSNRNQPQHIAMPDPSSFREDEESYVFMWAETSMPSFPKTMGSPPHGLHRRPNMENCASCLLEIIHADGLKNERGSFEGGVDAGFAMGGSVWYAIRSKILAF